MGLALLAVPSGACVGRPRVDMRLTPRQFGTADYDRILGRWTRERRVIKAFDTVINATVTYLSAEFVSAYAARYARHYRLTRAEQQAWLDGRLVALARRHEFFMAVTTADRQWNDFARKASIWRLVLEDDRGSRARPLTVQRIEVTEVHRVYFPDVGDFHQLYLITFPRVLGGKPFVTPRSKWFKLIIASPLGTAELAWFVKRAAPERVPPARASPGAPARPAAGEPTPRPAARRASPVLPPARR